MKAKKILALTALSLLGSLVVCSNKVETLKAEGEESFTEGDWRTVKGGSDSFSLEEGTFVGGSGAWMSNFYVKPFKEAIGDYQVTIKFQGTMTYPNTKQVQFGVIPWYLDDGNFLASYCEWSASQNVSGMYNFNLTGRINGNLPYRPDGSSFMAKEWDDIWMDNDNSTNASPASAENVIKIIKTRDEDGINDSFTYYFNDKLLVNGVKKVRDLKQHEGTIPMVGFYAYNDTFTIKDFKVEQLPKANLYSNVEGDIAVGKNGWTKTATGYSVDSTNVEGYGDAMLVDNTDVVDGSYGVQFAPEFSSTDNDAGINGLAWYKDQYNYVGGAIEKRGSKVYAGFKGQLVKRQDTALEFEQIDTTKEVNIDINNLGTIKVEKRGIKLRLLSGETLLDEYENKALITSQKTGIAAFGANVEFKNYEKLNSLPYIPYDWYTISSRGKTYYVSAASDTLGDATYDNGTFIFKDAAVTAGDNSKLSTIYYQATYSAYISMEVEFLSTVDDNTVFGVAPWIEDTSNYVRVFAKKTGITVEIVYAGEQTISQSYEYPAGFNFTTQDEYQTKLMKAAIDYEGKITVSIGNNNDGTKKYYEVVSKTANLVATKKNKLVTPNVGILAGGKSMKAKVLAINGFEPYSRVQSGDWELYGSMPDTWTVVDDNTITCSQANGTNYMSTRALKANSEKNFYMGATITSTNCSGAEQKAAFYPWYIDNSNYLIVMFSKWTSNASSSIVFTGRINGAVCGGTEWHDFTTAYTFENVANKLEVQIDGDHVYAYLNGASSPVQQVSFQGLSNRPMTGAKTGFFVYNADVTYDEFVLCSQERIYKITEKPVIEYVGTVKKTGVVGESVKLPVFTASNSIGDVLVVEVLVTDPNGDAVEVKGSKFTPQMEGIYHVKVTCTDNWGNEADPFEYDITVTAAGGTTSSEAPADSQPGGSTPTEKGGCGGSIAAGSLIVFALASAAGIIIKSKKND